MKTIHLAADTANGVFAIDPVDFPERELMNPQNFIGELHLLTDDERIFTAVTEGDEDYGAIKAEYGIN